MVAHGLDSILLSSSFGFPLHSHFNASSFVNSAKCILENQKKKEKIYLKQFEQSYIFHVERMWLSEGNGQQKSKYVFDWPDTI